LLHRLCRLEHGEDACDVRLKLPMSRHDLAGMLGIQPESLSRLLRRLIDDGLIGLSGRRILVHRVDRLGEGAGLAPCT
jgi:CRP/FNR family transcriptional regulator